ncbi:apoptosis regulator BAX-like isoform X2 [Narcine bancroftii]
MSPEDLGGVTDEINEPIIKEICKSLKKVGDELNRNAELQQVIDVIPVGDIQEVLQKVAESILTAKGLNWGRIVTFLYFAGKLVFKALKSLKALIQPIINWSLDIIQARVIPWIEQQGGWVLGTELPPIHNCMAVVSKIIDSNERKCTAGDDFFVLGHSNMADACYLLCGCNHGIFGIFEIDLRSAVHFLLVLCFPNTCSIRQWFYLRFSRLETISALMYLT